MNEREADALHKVSMPVAQIAAGILANPNNAHSETEWVAKRVLEVYNEILVQLKDEVS